MCYKDVTLRRLDLIHAKLKRNWFYNAIVWQKVWYSKLVANSTQWHFVSSYTFGTISTTFHLVQLFHPLKLEIQLFNSAMGQWFRSHMLCTNEQRPKKLFWFTGIFLFSSGCWWTTVQSWSNFLWAYKVEALPLKLYMPFLGKYILMGTL